MKQIITLLVALLLLGQEGLRAVEDFRERVYAQTDKQVYLAGELLWLKLCLTDASGVPASFSKVGYVELLDEAAAVVQAKIEIWNGVGEGWLELPAVLPTGYYRLVAYTRYMRNEGEAVFFQKTIGVVNTFRKDESVPTDTLQAVASADFSGNTLQLSLDKENFSRREDGHIRLRGIPEDTHTLSVSVAGREFIPVPDDMSVTHWKAALPTLGKGRLGERFLPEYEGHLITAKLVNARTGESAEQTGVSTLLGFVGDEVRVFGGQLQADASVLFYTTQIGGMRELATSTYSNTGETYRVDIQSPFAVHAAAEMPRFRLNPAWRTELTGRYVGLQATRLFTADSLGHVASALAHFRGRPYKTYVMKEWTRFSTMSESVFEFVESVSFRSRQDGGHSLFVLLADLSNQTVSLNTPLVLLDGIPIMDHELIYTYDPSLIKRLDVYRERYAFGGQVFEGILAFYTYKNDYPRLKVDTSTQLFDYEGTQSHRLFYAPAYPDEESRKSRVPDYRHTLLWLPTIETRGNSELEIPFSTSDLPGEYTVTVEGLTRSGKPVKAFVRFRVTGGS